MIGPLDAGPDGRLAVVTDPAGVAFGGGVWEAGEPKGAQLINEPGTWAMSALHTPSAERAQSSTARSLAGSSSRCPRRRSCCGGYPATSAASQINQSRATSSP